MKDKGDPMPRPQVGIIPSNEIRDRARLKTPYGAELCLFNSANAILPLKFDVKDEVSSCPCLRLLSVFIRVLAIPLMIGQTC